MLAAQLTTKPIEGQPYKRENCPFCQGHGKVWVKQHGSPIQITCDRCGGKGQSALHTK
jgi:DnaJ-class molecular chaperone